MSALRSPDKRDRPSLGHDTDTAGRRPKRGKYTPVACDECKRRKLKCLPGSNNDDPCQRCATLGSACAYAMPRRDPARNSSNMTEEREREAITTLSEDVRQLRAMVGDLVGTVGELKGRLDRPVGVEAAVATAAAAPTPVSISQSVVAACRGQEPSPSGTGSGRSPRSTRLSTRRGVRVPPEQQQPRFVGPTRSAYSIEIGELSLTEMGIPPAAAIQSESPSRSPSPEAQPPTGLEQPPTTMTTTTTNTNMTAPTTLNEAFWTRCDEAEVARIMTVFQEEITSVYPCWDTDYIVAGASDVLAWGRVREGERRRKHEREREEEDDDSDDDDSDDNNNEEDDSRIGYIDFQLAKVAMATVIVIEAHGKNENSARMVESVERNVSRILKPACNLKDLQLLVILSIYYFHCDMDLLAWRTIGLAAREALVMGLHRRSSLVETYPDKRQQSLATRVFWTIYILDRRWSFGTSLSFALIDRDIDPELPEPGPDYAYLQCMLGYGRLCSDLWDPLMSSNSSSAIPPQTTAALDIKTQEWLESIPIHLQLRHPRLGLAARPQPRILQRLRALLYLRGNHTRTLIYRHHLFRSCRLRADTSNSTSKNKESKAWLVVHIAQDSIQVLVHLNATSDIYRRQQNAFNYFLLSALAVIFLAVCHDPATFAEPCRQPFVAAVTLVRDFSRHSQASHRLWKSIRGLLPRLRELGMRASGGSEAAADKSNTSAAAPPMAPPAPAASAAAATASFYSSEPLEPPPMYNNNNNNNMAQGHHGHHGHGMDMSMSMPPMMDMQMQMQLMDGVDGGPGSTCNSASNWSTQADHLNTTSSSSSSMAIPDLGHMSSQLMTLFNVFENGQQFPPHTHIAPDSFTGGDGGGGGGDDNNGLLPAQAEHILGEEGEVFRRFQWLL